MNFGIGSIIEYSPFGGGTRRARVTLREAEGKNGRPTFDGVLLKQDNTPVEGDDANVWGYDSQILRIVTR